MAVPDFQTLMLPLLKFLGDQKEHSIRETIDALASILKITEEEKKERLPSGKQFKFDNRVRWAQAYLKMADLLESPRRSIIKISQRGLEVLKQNPSRIDIKFLRRFPEFQKTQNKSKKTDQTSSKIEVETFEQQTPQESIEDGYQKIREDLAQELLSCIKKCSPSFFERLVVELLVKMGYGGSIKDAGAAIGGSGDEGIDGIIKEDRLGLDVIYIQAKRWENTVSRPEIQKFAGALQGKRAKKGIFITTSGFSKQAESFAANIESKIVLVDGEMLAQYMIDFDIGVSKVSVYEVKKLDSDYFEDE